MAEILHSELLMHELFIDVKRPKWPPNSARPAKMFA